MNCNDVSARDLQFRPGDQWLRGKCLDSFCPLGPYLVTRDEISDPHDLSIKCELNGQLMQDSNTSEMVYRIPYLIEYLSQSEPGFHSFTRRCYCHRHSSRRGRVSPAADLA